MLEIVGGLHLECSTRLPNDAIFQTYYKLLFYLNQATAQKAIYT